MSKTKYTAEDIERGLQALAECGGNASQAAEKTGIPRGTLRYWAANKFADEFANIRREKRTGLIDKVWGMADDALLQVGNKLKKASANQAAVIFAIMVDKALLMGGEATEISETKIIDVRSDLERKLRQAVGAGAESGVSEEPE